MTESSERHKQLEVDRRVVKERLRLVGLSVDSIYDLVNTGEAYPQAIPCLIDLLDRVKDDRTLEGVARALTVKEARPIAARPLLRWFEKLPSATTAQEQVKWAFGNAIGVVADDSVFDDVLQLLRDRRHGWARSRLPCALGRSKTHRGEAINSLIELLSDPDVTICAISALGALNAEEARAPLMQLTSHTDKEIRSRATRAVARLDRIRSRKRGT